MKWFNNKQKKLEMIQGIKPTSKATLKLQCLFCCKGDIDEAKKLYDFFASDMPNLPDYDPVQPTFMQQVKVNATDIFQWIKENQKDILQGYETVRSIIQNKGALPVMPDAPTGEPLPDINK